MKTIRVISVLFLLFFTLLLIRGFVFSKTGPSTEDASAIPLEGNPHAIAINPFSGIAVVASAKPDEISIVDLAAQTVITTIHVGKTPLAVTIDSDLNYALVISRRDHTLSVIDLNTYQIIATIPVGKSPEGIAVSQQSGVPHVALVANNQNDSISVIDPGILRVIRTIPVGRKPKDVAIDSNLGLALVVNEQDQNVTVIDLHTYQATGTLPLGRKPRAISINPESHLAVVTDEKKDSITVINLQSWEMRSLHVEDNPIDVAINSLDNTALVICDRDNLLLRVDLDTNKAIGSYPLKKKTRGVAVDPFTNIAVVIDDKTDTLSLIQLPNPEPEITSISPDTLTRGGGATKVLVKGERFIKTSTLAGYLLDFIDNHHLEVTIPASLLSQTGDKPLVVNNPAPEGGSSNPTTLYIKNPRPTLTSLNPGSATAGTDGLVLTVDGSGFFEDTIVSINGVRRGLTRIDQKKIEIQLTAEDLEVGKYLDITAFNPSPGGGQSNGPRFTVLNPVPTLVSIDPSSIIARSPEFTLTLNGDHFVKTSIVNFNGQPVVSTHTNKTQLQATIPATAIATPGDYSVKVVNPAPGGGESNSLNFTVRPSLQITGFTPSGGPVGTAVIIYGTNLNAGGARISFNGVPAIVSKVTESFLTATVPLGATTGPIAITNELGTAHSATAFTVTSLYEFDLSVTPLHAKAAPGSQVTYTVSIAGNEGFSSLVTLNVHGLPEGFSGLFSPKTITKNQSSTLTISTCNCSLSNPATLTITGSATLEGKPVTRSASVTLELLTSGVTTLIGRVLDTEKRPIKNVTIKVGESSTTTDESGNFLLENPPTGEKIVLIDGFGASTETAKYPIIPMTMNIVSGQTNSLPYTPHLHAQKNYNFTPISQVNETIVEDPEIPGFQMRIPAGVRIMGWDGQPNIKVSVRRVPIEVLPVPPPPPEVQGRTVYMFYFDKKGGGLPDVPIPVTLPNDLGMSPGEKANLWYYNESPNPGEAPNDWSLAGQATVSQDGKTISTDPGVGIPRFCCGAVAVSPPPTQTKANIPPGDDLCIISKQCSNGHSVEPSTGVFLHGETDLTLPGRIPITLARSYRTLESYSGLYGSGTYFSYDWFLSGSRNMATLITPPGSRIYFNLQADGTYINTSEPMYRGATVKFNADGTRTLRMKNGATYTFNAWGVLTEQADRNGNKLTILRQWDGGITQIIGADGRTMVTFTQGRLGNQPVITGMTDVTGRKVYYTYDPQSIRLTAVTNPEWGVTQYQYDSAGRMTKIIDPRGNTALNVTYDVNSRVCQEGYGDGGAYKFYYITADQASTPKALNLLAEAASGGPITAPICSALVTKSPITHTIAVNPNGNITTYRFYSSQKIISVTNSNGQTSASERDPVTNLLKSRTDSVGRKTTYTYDANGNRTSMINPAGNTTFYEYETTYNLLTRITDPLGRVTRYEYDSKGNMTKAINLMGNEMTMAYDGYGQLISVMNSLGNTTRFEYDSPGNLSGIIGPLGNRSTRAYDVVSRLVSNTDEIGNTTAYAYNKLDKVTEIVDPAAKTTKLQYDANGNLTKVTDANGHSISYAYDSDNRMIAMTDPLGNSEAYQYDLNDNVIRFTDRKGQTTRYTYNASNKTSRIDYSDGSFTDFTYDSLDRLMRIDDSISGPLEYEYENIGGCAGCGGWGRDRIKREITALGVVEYKYDIIGRRTSMRVSDQDWVDYQYNDNNLLTNITHPSLGTFNMSYDTASRRTDLSLPNGVITNYTYDQASQLLNMKHSASGNVLEEFKYDYDSSGDRVSTKRLMSPQILLPETGSATFNDGNQMQIFNDKAMTYDKNGNLTSVTNSCGTTTYSWDSRNRLNNIDGYNADCSPLSARFRYDALGRRVEKTINQKTVQYLYDGMDIMQEIEAGAVSGRYIRSLNIDEPFARLTSKALRFYHTDALGSVIGLTDESGTVKTSYVYEPFGSVDITGDPTNNPFQYTGRENDGTGLYYYRARYYSPELGRFISEDPIGLAGGMNPFSYVQNNPSNFVDPWGLLGAPWHFGLSLVAGLKSGMGIGGSLSFAWNSMWVDFAPGSQGFDAAATAQHAMAGMVSVPGGERRRQTREDAIKAANDFIQNNKACGNLAKAAHAAQDLETPRHDGQPWTGFGDDWNTVFHIYRDLDPVINTVIRAYRNTLEVLK